MDLRLIADIKSAEGCRLTAYRDSLGFWTIGYGHLLDQDTNWTEYSITKEQAEALLRNDLEQAYERALYLPEWPYLDTACRQNAVIELVFNLGVSKWRQFAKTRLDIQRHAWRAAHDDLLNSLWAEQVGLTRSNRLAQYLLTGEYA